MALPNPLEYADQTTRPLVRPWVTLLAVALVTIPPLLGIGGAIWYVIEPEQGAVKTAFAGAAAMLCAVPVAAGLGLHLIRRGEPTQRRVGVAVTAVALLTPVVASACAFIVTMLVSVGAVPF